MTRAIVALALLLAACAEREDLARARQLYRAGMFAEAITVAKEAIAKTPDEVRAHLLLGECYVGAGNLEQAKAAFGRAVRLEPARRAEVAGILLAAARAAAADASAPRDAMLALAVEFDPPARTQAAGIYSGRAVTSARQGQAEAAAEYFAQARRYDAARAAEGAAKLAQACLECATARLEQEDDAAAEKLFALAVECAPAAWARMAQAWARTAVRRAKAGDVGSARECVERARACVLATPAGSDAKQLARTFLAAGRAALAGGEGAMGEQEVATVATAFLTAASLDESVVPEAAAELGTRAREALDKHDLERAEPLARLASGLEAAQGQALRAACLGAAREAGAAGFRQAIDLARLAGRIWPDRKAEAASVLLELLDGGLERLAPRAAVEVGARAVELDSACRGRVVEAEARKAQALVSAPPLDGKNADACVQLMRAAASPDRAGGGRVALAILQGLRRLCRETDATQREPGALRTLLGASLEALTDTPSARAAGEHLAEVLFMCREELDPQSLLRIGEGALGFEPGASDRVLETYLARAGGTLASPELCADSSTPVRLADAEMLLHAVVARRPSDRDRASRLVLDAISRCSADLVATGQGLLFALEAAVDRLEPSAETKAAPAYRLAHALERYMKGDYELAVPALQALARAHGDTVEGRRASEILAPPAPGLYECDGVAECNEGVRLRVLSVEVTSSGIEVRSRVSLRGYERGAFQFWASGAGDRGAEPVHLLDSTGAKLWAKDGFQGPGLAEETTRTDSYRYRWINDGEKLDLRTSCALPSPGARSVCLVFHHIASAGGIGFGWRRVMLGPFVLKNSPFEKPLAPDAPARRAGAGTKR